MRSSNSYLQIAMAERIRANSLKNWFSKRVLEYLSYVMVI